MESHPYAITKGIGWAAGAGRAVTSGRVIGKGADCIVVTIRDISTGKVVGVQCINSAGAKQTFGPVFGHGLVFGNHLDKSIPWHVTVEWPSAVSIVFHHLEGDGVAAVAFGKSNLDTVAHRMAKIYQPDKIRILRERDD